jgi:hypothetical protein
MNECEYGVLVEWCLMEKLKYMEKNWTQWHFVPQKSHLNSRGIEQAFSARSWKLNA